MLRKSVLLASFAIVLGVAPGAGAQASGTLTVTATVESSIGLTVELPGPADQSRDDATVATGPSAWTLSSPIRVRVSTANMAGNDYTLAQLDLQPAPGVTWSLGSSRPLRSMTLDPREEIFSTNISVILFKPARTEHRRNVCYIAGSLER